MIMIGFEISINGREPIVAASDYFVFADLTFGCSSGRIKIKGSDPNIKVRTVRKTFGHAETAGCLRHWLKY